MKCIYSWLESLFLMSVNDCSILKAALTHDGVVQLGLMDSSPALWHTGRCVRDQQGCSQVPPNQPPSQHCVDGNNQWDNLENA